MVELHVANVVVEGSNPFSRSIENGPEGGRFFMVVVVGPFDQLSFWKVL